MKKIKCISCENEIKDKDAIGLNKKMIDPETKMFYCMECLADFFEVTIQDLKDKIKEFKEQGCTLFQ